MAPTNARSLLATRVMLVLLSICFISTAIALQPRSMGTINSMGTISRSHIQNINTVYHDWAGQPPSLFYENDVKMSCTKCTSMMQSILDDVTNQNTSTELAVSSSCNQIEDQHQRVKCYELGHYLAVKINFVLAEEIDWQAADFCAFAKQCTIDCCSTDSVPEQIIMTVGETIKDRHFVWTTRTANTPQYLQISTDSHFASNFALIKNFTSTVVTYDAGSWTGYIHRVFIADLDYNTTYYYRMGLPNDNILSETFHFTVQSIDLGKDTNPSHIMVFGDMDLTDFSTQSRQLIEKQLDTKNNIHAALLLGDLGYIDGNEAKWQPWMMFLQNTFTKRGIPIISCPGNHESMFYELMVGYAQRFPRSNGSSDIILYGSHTFGNLHIQTLNSESMSVANEPDLDDIQQKWAVQDLSIKAAKQPWKISSLHRPLYCSSHDPTSCETYSGGGLFFRQRLEDIFIKNQVDMIFYGHVHSYERSTAVKDTVPTPQQCILLANTPSFVSEVCQQGNGPIYVLAGNGGNSHSPGDPTPDRKPFTSQTWLLPGFGILTISDDIMKHDYYDGRTQSIVDTIVIQRK